jgi:general stress protein 26
MSNNRDVEFDGDSWFFPMGDTQVVGDIARSPNVGMTLHGNSSMLGKPPVFITVAGTAKLIRDEAAFEEHWNKDLERWFEQGTDTPGLTLIKVHAEHVHYWNGEEQGGGFALGLRCEFGGYCTPHRYSAGAMVVPLF